MESNAIGNARAMRDLIRAHRDETERERRLAAPIVEKLVETRLCRMSLEPDLGGLATPAVESLEVYETLAEAEVSVPWIAWNTALIDFLSRYLPEPARKELFADPSWLIAQSTKPCGTAEIEGDSYRLSGRWPLVSGCELADWIVLTSAIAEGGVPRSGPDGAPETRFLFVPREECEILDTWHVGGLRGTGSHDVVVRDVRVPRKRSLSPADGAQPMADPIGRVPIIPTMCAAFAAQTLGLAKLCLETALELARTKVTLAPVPDLRDRPAAQAAIPVHEAAVAAARTHLHARVDATWQAAVAGRPETPEERAAVYGAGMHAVEVSRAAVDLCYGLGGTSSLYTDCPLERAHRDLHAMLRHVVASTAFVEDAGRVRFGLEPVSPLYPL